MIPFLSWFRKPKAVPESRFDLVEQRNVPQSMELRRWEAATVTDQNALQWINATGRTLNEDLVNNLGVLITRCTHELTVNPTIQGAADTHSADIVSPGGPSWQVVPKSANVPESEAKALEAYIGQAEELIREWFDHCDYNSELSGAEILQISILQQWTCGNAFQEILEGGSSGLTPISLRLLPIHAERVLRCVSGGSVRLGIERDKSGKRLRYHVATPESFGTYSTSKAEPVEARQMIHHMRTIEPGQIAGVPWLASGLGTLGDLRQLDEQVMKAAQLAASLAIIFQDKHENAPVVAGAQAVKLGLTNFFHAPKGKEVKTLDPKQPQQNYVAFRDERWRDVARSLSMPLLIFRQNSAEHTYSGARMDRLLYARSIEKEQWLIDRRMSPVFDQVLREAMLRKLLPKAPVPVRVIGVYAPIPCVDPVKEAVANQTQLQTLTKSLIDVWHENGITAPEAVSKLRRSIEVLDQIRPGLGEKFVGSLLGDAGLLKSDASADGLISALAG
ncbi:MAG: phage portal protein [Planctomycetaceae bacterium]